MMLETARITSATVPNKLLRQVSDRIVRGCLLLLALVPVLAPIAARAQQAAQAQQEIRFSVLGLFHPGELVLEQASPQVLSISAMGDAVARTFVLNGEPGHRQILFHAEGGRVAAGPQSAANWTVAARDGGAIAFRLTVPGRFHRIYRGRLSVIARSGKLVAVVTMDRETAVASIVAAEMEDNSPIEALKAQAVVARSFLLAGARHQDFDFCDTTHCQFVKSPPPVGGRISSAVRSTRGLVIAYRDKPLGAMYSSRCGGQTRSLRDIGMEPGEGYPYFAVPCAWCQRHPFVWRSKIGKSSHAPEPGDERRRIAEVRQWGWSTIPGNDFKATADSAGWQLEGHSVGHGVGMCQYGAMGMASSGASFREILAHYYPNTSLITLP